MVTQEATRMQLTTTGAVKLGYYLARRTKDEQWMVTTGGRIVGYAEDLAEAEAMASKDTTRRRERLAQLEERAKQRHDEYPQDAADAAYEEHWNEEGE